MVTAPKGHGRSTACPIPTIDVAPADARRSSTRGSPRAPTSSRSCSMTARRMGTGRPSLDEATLRAVIRAARARDARVVVHVSTQAAAQAALAAGAHGLVHVFADAPPTPDLVALANKAGAFVIPTLAVIESVTGTPGAPRCSPWTRWRRTSCRRAGRARRRRSRPTRAPACAGARARTTRAAPRRRRADPRRIGRAQPRHDARRDAAPELELLTRAGLTPSRRCGPRRSDPARAFGLDDRGRIAPGLRADLVLVAGQSGAGHHGHTPDRGVWKAGHGSIAVPRRARRTATSDDRVRRDQQLRRMAPRRGSARAGRSRRTR
jgi:hypothetical protein